MYRICLLAMCMLAVGCDSDEASSSRPDGGQLSNDAGPGDGDASWDGGVSRSCIDSGECTDPSAPRCEDGACVGCKSNVECETFANARVCSESGVCVQCSASEAQACEGTTNPACAEDLGQCVGCNADADCSDVAAAACDVAIHTCKPCEANEQCSRFENANLCIAGACVECTPNKDDPTLEGCDNGRACDPATLTCTGAMRGTVSGCAKCVSDSECFAGTRCVPTSFAGAPHGTYCLLAAPESPTLCPNRYAVQRSATSVLGVVDDYCFPDDTITTCEALLDFGNSCMGMDDQCGAEGLDDGLCRGGLCTYGCARARDCSGSTDDINSCVGAPGARYCDPN